MINIDTAIALFESSKLGMIVILCCIAIGMIPFDQWAKAFIVYLNRWRLALDIFRIRRNKWVAAVTFNSEPCGGCLHRSSIHFITTERWRDMTSAEVQTAWSLVRIIDPKQMDTTKGRMAPGLCFTPEWLPPEKHLSVVIHPDAGSAH